MAKFPRGHAATKKLIASCAANGVGIDCLPDAPGFRFIPAADLPRSPFDSSPAALPRNSFTNGLPCGEPTKRGTLYFGKPKPKHIKNWTPARLDMNPQYAVRMAGDDCKLTIARKAYAEGDPQPLRDYLRGEANRRRVAEVAAVEPFQYALAA